MTKDNFDWVEARSQCTVKSVFNRLHQEVHEDIQSFDVRYPGMSQCIAMQECGDAKDRFYVERHWPAPGCL